MQIKQIELERNDGFDWVASDSKIATKQKEHGFRLNIACQKTFIGSLIAERRVAIWDEWEV